MENKKIITRVCSMCSKEVDDGIIIKGNSICYQCEREIVYLDLADINKYDLYVNKINKVILG